MTCVWPRYPWCFYTVVILLLAAEFVWTQDSYFGSKCHIQTERIGCFKDTVIPSRPIPVLLFTDRDSTSPVYTGGFVDLKNWNLYMGDLKCRCAEEARGKGYKMFGLQWYGECWSGPNAHETYKINGPSDKCVTHDLAQCTDEEEQCVGRDFVNFVYEIAAANASHNATEKHIHNETEIATGYNNTHLHVHIHHNVTVTTPAPTTTTTPKPSPEPTIPPPLPPPMPSPAPVYVPCQSGCIPPLTCPTTYPCSPVYTVYSDDKTNPQLKRKKIRLLARILKHNKHPDGRAGQLVTFLVGSLKREGDVVKDTSKKLSGHQRNVMPNAGM